MTEWQDRIQRRVAEAAATASNAGRRAGLLPATKDFQRYVIVSTIRTGSSMLVSYLNSHPRATCFFEPFHRHSQTVPFAVRGYERAGRRSAVAALHRDDPVRFAEDWLFGPMPPCTRAVGFKLLYTQGRFGTDHWWHGPEYEDWWAEIGLSPSWGTAESDLWAWLAKVPGLGGAGVRVIHLRRENLLRAVVSGQIAHQTKKWGATASGGHTTDAGCTVTLDPEALLRDFEAEARFARDTAIQFADRPVFNLSYERLLENPAGELAAVQEFLGLPQATLITKTRKQSVTPLAELIANYDQVRDALADTRYARLLDDSAEPPPRAEDPAGRRDA